MGAVKGSTHSGQGHSELRIFDREGADAGISGPRGGESTGTESDGGLGDREAETVGLTSGSVAVFRKDRHSAVEVVIFATVGLTSRSVALSSKDADSVPEVAIYARFSSTFKGFDVEWGAEKTVSEDDKLDKSSEGVMGS